MKIYILRHEDRTMDATFFSPLTKEGMDNSIKLVDSLEECDIDSIYSSPFIRTLQTILPYSKHKNLKINVDNSLAEIQHPHLIPVKSYKITLPEYIAEQFNCNMHYTGCMEASDHMYPEDESNVSKRVKRFITKLVNENLNSKHNIVIVTHQIVCNNLIKRSTKKMKGFDYDITYNYPKGGLTKIFDKDEWVFKPINWKYTVKSFD